MSAMHNGNGKALVDRFGNPLVSDRAATRGYRPGPRFYWFQHPRDVPLFTFLMIYHMLRDETIRLGLRMRAAPLARVEFAYKKGNDWIPGVKAAKEEVADFVERQLARIWQRDIYRILEAQTWGWAAAEVLYRVNRRTRQYEFDRMNHIRAENALALESDGNMVGVEVSGVTHTTSKVRLQSPGKSLWHVYSPEPGSLYGYSVLFGAYDAWCDKCLNGGAKDVRRLFMHADAYGGKRIGYPDGSTMIGEQRVPNRDIALEMVESYKSGEVMTYPMQYDEHGHELWKITDATVTSNPGHILQFPKDLDVAMLRGMEIPDDVLTAENSGSWEGKMVPMAAFYTALDRWAQLLVGDVVRCIIEPLVLWNYGPVDFEVGIKPLDVQALEQQRARSSQGEPGDGGKQAGPTGGFPDKDGDPTTPMGRNRPIRLSLGGSGYEYSCVLLNLPEETAEHVRQMAAAIHADDRVKVEDEPHITVKYGLTTNNPEPLLPVLAGRGPVVAKLGKTACFENENEDVVYIEVESESLHELNRLVAAVCPHRETHPQYIPHVTVAYVKPGTGRFYAGWDDLAGTIVTFDTLTFSPASGSRRPVQLVGPPLRLSLAGKKIEQAIGEGVLGAAEMVKAARKMVALAGKRKKAKGQKEFDWITIGGSPGPDGQHEGGTPVAVNTSGEIVAGPKKLEGRKIGELDKDVAGTEKDKQKDAEPPVKPDLPKPQSGAERGAAVYEGKKYRTIAPKSRISLDQAKALLVERGYEVGPPASDPATGATYYAVQKHGQQPIRVTAKQISAFLATEGDDIREVLSNDPFSLKRETEKPAPKKPDYGSSGGKQSVLIHGQNDLPGQMDIFDDMNVATEHTGKKESPFKLREANDTEPLSEKKLFERSGRQFDSLQAALGFNKPLRGPKGAQRIQKALEKMPGGAVIAALLAVDGSQTGYDDNGFPMRGNDAFTAAIDGKFSKEELDAAKAWLYDTFNPSRPLAHVNQHRWLHGVVRVARPKSAILNPATKKSAWKKNSDGTYTAPNGTVWRKAKAGGETSPVTGKFFKGGALMPIHGLSQKQPKPEGEGVASLPAKPNENAKPKQKEPRAVPRLTPEEIETERISRERKRLWSEITAGPLGQLKWLGDSPNHKAMRDSRISLEPWRAYAERIGPRGIALLVEELEPQVLQRIKDDVNAEHVKNPNDHSGNPWDKDEAIDWEKRQLGDVSDALAYQPRKTSKHHRENPQSLYVRNLLQKAWEQAADVGDMHALHQVLQNAETRSRTND
jgi:2'-5' RNA ligase